MNRIKAICVALIWRSQRSQTAPRSGWLCQCEADGFANEKWRSGEIRFTSPLCGEVNRLVSSAVHLITQLSVLCTCYISKKCFAISIYNLYFLSAQLNGRVTVSKTVGMGSTPFALVNSNMHQYVWPKGYTLFLQRATGPVRTTQPCSTILASLLNLLVQLAECRSHNKRRN